MPQWLAQAKVRNARALSEPSRTPADVDDEASWTSALEVRRQLGADITTRPFSIGRAAASSTQKCEQRSLRSSPTVSEFGNVAADFPRIETSCFEDMDIELDCVARATDGVLDCFMAGSLRSGVGRHPPSIH